MRRHFTVALVALADDPVMPDAAPSTLADAVSAVAAAHRAADTKWPHMLMVSRWEFAGRAIGGRLLTSPSSLSLTLSGILEFSGAAAWSTGMLKEFR
ncbi:hypothetical protein ACFCV9_03295 [Streptomyces sp. NPDC056367]|uniref:hypothetical protein n=1 Tax=Streptomyces sp. NPDC056367 TaxID=3345797 RepID=UPI0035D687C0